MAEATKSYMPKRKPQDKNVEYDNVGDKRGRIFVQNQDIAGLPLKKRKVKLLLIKKLTEGNQKNEESNGKTESKGEEN